MTYASFFSRAAMIVAPALLLAACDGAAPDTSNSAPAAQTSEPAPAPVEQAQAPEPAPAPTGRTEAEEPRFVGLWAADVRMCQDKAWRFTPDSLTTPAGSICRFDEVTPVPGGYDIAARCTAEGPETEDKLEIRFAESADAMLFESDVIADAGLVECEAAG